MSETPISISSLNDFVFCPVSIYFHSIDADEDDLLIKDEYQLKGTDSHKSSDSATYSTKKSMLQNICVYCEQYNLYGRIDTFDVEKGILTERKKKIKTVFDGYIFQLYAQYFALIEMGYTVKKLRLYSMDDNKIYSVKKPESNTEMYEKFNALLKKIDCFSFETFCQENAEKCNNCIYEPLCSFSIKK